MRRRFFQVLAFVTLLFCAGCMAGKGVVRHPDQLQFQPLEFNFPEVERFETSNGIRVFFKEDRELPLITITAVVGGGSLEDPDDKVGLGDLFGTVLRTGGAGGFLADELDEILETMGADLGVGTDTYATTLNLSVRSTDLESGMAILHDLLRAPRFAPQRLELARKKEIEGIRRRNDLPRTVAHRSLERWLYQGHPLGRESTTESVSNVARDDLLAFHQRHFHPNNMWLAVSGDLGEEDLKNLLVKVFGDWPRVEMKPTPVPPLPEKPDPVLLLTRKEVPQTNILMGNQGIDKSAPDLAACQVMNFILGGGGFNSRLMREIRSNRGLAYSIYSYFQIGRRLPGLFLIGGETKSESTIEVVNLVRDMMNGMRTTEVSGDELRLAKESLVNSFVFAFTDSHAVVARELRLDFYDYPEGYLENYRDRIASVSAADVLEAARRHLDPADLTIALVGDDVRFEAPPASLGLKIRPGIEEGKTPN
jgi:zinc protease